MMEQRRQEEERMRQEMEMEQRRQQEERMRQEMEMEKRRQEEENLMRQRQVQEERQQQELIQQQEKKAIKTQGFSYGVKQQDISQLARPPVNSGSVFESSQSQQFSSVQQSSTSFSQTQSTNQIYESQEVNGGVMKGYKVKD